MRGLKSVIGAALLAAICLPAGTAEARRAPAPWCAVMGGGGWGGYDDCAYYSLRQCLETIRGVGVTCRPNPYASPAADTDPASFEEPPRRRRHVPR